MTESLDTAYSSVLYKPPSLLPISKYKDELLYLTETYPVTIVVGQTGSGKTTQLPKFLEQGGWCNQGKIIAVTQPRRLAATTVATRVAGEYGCELGKEVGYSIRFEDVTSSATRIKFLTDGLLLREVLVDPLLSRYNVIMIDEAHERTLSTDILLGVLKKILKRRRQNDLRVIISSATLQAEAFLRFFMENHSDSSALNSDAETSRLSSGTNLKPKQENPNNGSDYGRIICLEGRAYPVDIHYLKNPTDDYLKRAVQTVLDIHMKESKGDILVFLTGREEIEKAIESLSEQAAILGPKAQQIMPLPLYAGLPIEKQLYVFEEAPEDTRKVIFSTNIAEASVTIDGIVFVVDSGFLKLRAYNPTNGIDILTVTPISKASATQRAGRAGRTSPGKCFRLYTESDYEALPDVSSPEIQRSNLTTVILQLKALGIDNIARFDFLTPPPAELVIRALELLYSLGALDDYAKLTRPLGVRMAEIAVDPMLAKTLLSASSFNCLSEILTIAAMISLDGGVWFHHDGEKKRIETAQRKFATEEGDHLMLLNVYQAFVTIGKKEGKFCHENFINFKAMLRAVNIRAQLKRYLERFGINVDETLSSRKDKQSNSIGGLSKSEQIRRCLTTGFFAHAAKMQPDGTFRNVQGDLVLHAHPSSLMFNRKADWVIFHAVVETGNKTFIRDVTKIDRSWLVEYAPGYYKNS
ncbi:putative ATP-dependent RNA helicase DHX35 [Erysiphe necator]|uniref:RNA helicase n=1 Tax=Uncinula necator TaxID=52586 RepID=A0A0B1PA60_UNCNE|nr:putative ATP-dependent RNA helicase DHX35 [Erysiphe necator]KHJ33559.1 putative p-loop containing nucleoside triphosphate hydrolase [Erysiphe necator]